MVYHAVARGKLTVERAIFQGQVEEGCGSWIICPEITSEATLAIRVYTERAWYIEDESEHNIEDEIEHESNTKATSTTFLPKNRLDSEYLWQAGGDWADPNGLLSQGHVSYPVPVDYQAQAKAQAEAQRTLERGIQGLRVN
ncbi:hypothetical protein CSHISOI_11551 [Colletotrichum shisoi]|uniref:Uncharacterized protein n=1 Tax=Colletotrichum shisoi TaxID=2078593 RepID=A0A5Q4BAD0_9PEZI|nr:hypothetical protein CSHISOI_11551 [Colletotrichum shisoi]